jgi:hypothetical protein
MKTSISNPQTIVLTSVLSAGLLFGVRLSLYGYYTQMADAKKSHHSGSSCKDATPDNTPVTSNLATQTQQQPAIPGTIQLSTKEAQDYIQSAMRCYCGLCYYYFYIAFLSCQ